MIRLLLVATLLALILTWPPEGRATELYKGTAALAEQAASDSTDCAAMPETVILSVTKRQGGFTQCSESMLQQSRPDLDNSLDFAQQRCCKICKKGKACGNSCINRSYTCRQPPGCACDG